MTRLYIWHCTSYSSINPQLRYNYFRFGKTNGRHTGYWHFSAGCYFDHNHSKIGVPNVKCVIVNQMYQNSLGMMSSVLNTDPRQSVSQSVSQWNAWPATGRSALQDLRSCAILQASLGLSPVSSSICCTHVQQGRPRWRFHSGLMSGLPPARASTARRSAEWAGVASSSRRTWPKMESRLRQIRIAKPLVHVPVPKCNWCTKRADCNKCNENDQERS